MLTRRRLLAAGLSSAAATLAPRPSRSQGSPLGQNRLVLLGTKGGPAIRAGCFGCMLSGWSLVLGVAGVALLVYLIWGLVASR